MASDELMAAARTSLDELLLRVQQGTDHLNHRRFAALDGVATEIYELSEELARVAEDLGYEERSGESLSEDPLTGGA